MPHATLTIDLPEATWIGSISRAHPDATFRVLAAVATGDGGVGLAELEGSDIETVVQELRARETVTELSLFDVGDRRATVQLETNVPILLFPLRDSGVPVEMPLEVRAGTVEIEVTCSQSRLSTLGDKLDQFGIEYTVERVFHSVGERPPLLTPRQRELLELAAEEGYYDTPRETSITEMAENHDVAKSTLSETLHRAEERLVKQFFDDASGAPSQTTSPVQSLSR